MTEGFRGDEVPPTREEVRKGGFWLSLMGVAALALIPWAGEFGDRAPLLAMWVGSVPAGTLAGRHQGLAFRRGKLRPANRAVIVPLVTGAGYFLYVTLGDGFALVALSLIGGASFGMGLVMRHYAN